MSMFLPLAMTTLGADATDTHLQYGRQKKAKGKKLLRTGMSLPETGPLPNPLLGSHNSLTFMY